MVQLVQLLSLSEKVIGFHSGLEPFYVELHVVFIHMWVFSRSSVSSHRPKTCMFGWLFLGVNSCLSCLSLYDSVMILQLAQGLLFFSLKAVLNCKAQLGQPLLQLPGLIYTRPLVCLHEANGLSKTHFLLFVTQQWATKSKEKYRRLNQTIQQYDPQGEKVGW